MPVHPFDEAIEPHPILKDPSSPVARYRLRLPSRWSNQHGTVVGGIVASAALNAAIHHLKTKNGFVSVPNNVHVNFLAGFVGNEDGDVQIEVLRESRRFVFVELRVRQRNNVVASVIATLAAKMEPAKSEGTFPNLELSEYHNPPAIPPIDQCVPYEGPMSLARGAAEPPFSALRDFRMDPSHAVQVEVLVSRKAYMWDVTEQQRRFDFPSVVWGGFCDSRPLDHLALVWLLDGIVPLNLALGLSTPSSSHLVGWSTLSYSIHFLNAEADNGQHAIVDAKLTWTSNGKAELVVTAWNKDGKVLAVGKQMGVLSAREKVGGVSARARTATRL
ncbi:hypothetical protein HDU93_004126 [Gonapodya sp. JEL0774]|nr:hypothetical protein HDU93_004126 [Gonapodya sp. JEL0774]